MSDLYSPGSVYIFPPAEIAEIGTEQPLFLFWEYLFRNFGILSLQCTSLCQILFTYYSGRVNFAPSLFNSALTPHGTAGGGAQVPRPFKLCAEYGGGGAGATPSSKQYIYTQGEKMWAGRRAIIFIHPLIRSYEGKHSWL